MIQCDLKWNRSLSVLTEPTGHVCTKLCASLWKFLPCQNPNTNCNPDSNKDRNLWNSQPTSMSLHCSMESRLEFNKTPGGTVKPPDNQISILNLPNLNLNPNRIPNLNPHCSSAAPLQLHSYPQQLQSFSSFPPLSATTFSKLFQ